MTGSEPNFVEWFLSLGDQQKVKWMKEHRPVHVIAAGELGDPCRWCIHWGNMCGPDKGQACTNHSNFTCRLPKRTARCI